LEFNPFKREKTVVLSHNDEHARPQKKDYDITELKIGSGQSDKTGISDFDNQMINI